jgi:hypothetical protein
MFTNVALDVFIGLTFVFLLYSLLASILMEVIASFFNLRAAILVKAMRAMLEDRKPRTLQSTTRFGRLLERLRTGIREKWHYLACILPDNTLAKAFYKHPGVKYLSGSVLRTKPSYIEPTNFSTTIVRILRGRDFDGAVPDMQAIRGTLYPLDTSLEMRAQTATVEVGNTERFQATIQPETLDQLRQIYIDAGGELERFKAQLEQWFDETMNRANGWYKRQSRAILFFIGFGIAIACNVDTIRIHSILSKDKAAREQMVQLASGQKDRYTTAIDARRQPAADAANLFADSVQRQLVQATYNNLQGDMKEADSVLGLGWGKEGSFNGIRSIVGWLLTALALTLGAPFWFDLLNKLISLRATGNRPQPPAPDDTKAAGSGSVRTVAVPAATTATTTTGDEEPEIVADEAFNQTIAQG